MKLISGLILMLGITQLLLASSKFKLDVGEEPTVLAGDTIDLNGKVLSGDKSKIDYYQWEENGKVLKNTSGDEIVYWDEANAENEYLPKGRGIHVLKLVVFDTLGKKYTKRLKVNVESTANIKIGKDDLKFDISPEFPVKREQRPEGNFRLSRGHYLDVNVGDVIPLSGIVDASKKHLVDSYRWELNGKIIKNQLGDEILYWDEENRENDYVPKVAGREFLKFIVTDINGKETSKTLLLKISDKQGDHDNDMASATKIELNKIITAKKQIKNDHDFFKFEIDEKKYVQVVFRQKGPRKVRVLSANGEELVLKYQSIPASGGMYRMYQTVFEKGVYYVDVLAPRLGDYTLEIITDNIENDKYGDSKSVATELQLGSKTVGYINTREDIDYFYVVAPQTGQLIVKNIADNAPYGVDINGVYFKSNNNASSYSFNVEKGKKYYIALTYHQSRYNTHFKQFKYKLSLSLK